jgi:TldD protein
MVETAARAVELLGRGALLADLFRESSTGGYVTVEDRKVEEAGTFVSCGAGLRAVFSDRVLFSHASTPSSAELLILSRELSGGGKPGRIAWREPVIANPSGASLSQVSLKEKAKLCLGAEKAARGFDKRVRQVRVSCRDFVREILLAREDGLIVSESQRGIYFSVFVVATGGKVTQTGYEAVGQSTGWELFDTVNPEEIALTAAKRAVRMLGARKAPAGAMAVVLSSTAGGTMIHEAVGHGLEGDLVGEGYSAYEGKIGKQVASPIITVMDDPTLPGKRGSYIYDDEGTVASPTLLVERGVLRGFLHSRRSAAVEGHAPTGNGRRESFAHPPIPRMSNTFIAPGLSDPGDILRSTKSGLYVTRMGGGEVNTLSGDFVFEVSEGFMIEDGEIGEPVRGATLAGNGPRVLLEIDMAGRDLGFAPGTCGKDGQGVPVADAQPTLRIPELVVGSDAEQR